jgi:hypothetical protein
MELALGTLLYLFLLSAQISTDWKRCNQSLRLHLNLLLLDLIFQQDWRLPLIAIGLCLFPILEIL